MKELKLWKKYSQEVNKKNAKRWIDCLKMEKEFEEKNKKRFEKELEEWTNMRNFYLTAIKGYERLPFIKRIFRDKPEIPYKYKENNKPFDWYMPSMIIPFLEHITYENFLDWRVKNKL